jgi:membrane-associated phospholipid phosphatase
MQPLNIQQFRYAALLCILFSAALFTASYTAGKAQLFLLLNTNLGTVADYFFGLFTNAGDALMWVAALLAALFVLKQKRAWPLLVSGFVVSTVLTHICKDVLMPYAPRPWKAIANHSLIHHVSFIQPWLISSFPSGHTTTAFTIYLVFCLLLPGRWSLGVGLLYALLVGYSRIYVAQHFPFDVAAGMLVGTLSALISLPIQKAYLRDVGVV